jgi:hypothetical protein
VLARGIDETVMAAGAGLLDVIRIYGVTRRRKKAGAT